MTLTLDTEIATALAPLAEAMAAAVPPPVGDIQTRRVVLEKLIGDAGDAEPMASDVSITDFHTATADGHRLLLRWYTKNGASPGSAALYLHGGGMILGHVGLFDHPLARYVSRSGVPILAVEYRLAPENPHPVPVEDAYAGLVWLREHSDELRIDPERIAVLGDSAGGGLAAAVALLARDRGGPHIARQILLFPMLDDRTTTPDESIAPFALWTYDDNITAWTALLGDDAGGPDVSPYAAPARAADLTGLPPAYVEVGQLDIFRDEDIEYARRLANAGVEVEFHLRPGVPHEFESLALDADVSRRAIADRVRVLASL